MTTPSQPQISDDGRFYWDGTHWVPLPQPQVGTPEGEPLLVRSKEGSGKALFMLALIVVVLLFAFSAR